MNDRIDRFAALGFLPWAFVLFVVALALSGCQGQYWGSGQFAGQVMQQIGQNCDIQGSIPGAVNFHCYANRGTLAGPTPAVTVTPTQPALVVSPSR